MIRLTTLCASVLCCICPAQRAIAVQFEFEQNDKDVSVHIDGELFTVYRVRSGRQPVLWPIIGPTGPSMTRAYPMLSA